jgi:2-polyprenyl-3-methyl-5-hydroxy-6-metoxy-1,4-benzoquinol methylase
MSQPWLARLYGHLYDAVVDGFPPFEELVDEVAGIVEGESRARAVGPARILDVACGTGSVALRLARRGHAVTGIDSVPHLVEIARRRPRGGADVRFEAFDLAHRPAAGPTGFDVLVSMHTLYWHPEPEAFLRGCYHALRPDGRAVFLTYERPASVVSTWARVRQERGALDAFRALRWLVPTAAFEAGRRGRRRYLGPQELRAMLAQAGFEVSWCRPAFLGGVSLLAWARRRPTAGGGCPSDPDVPSLRRGNSLTINRSDRASAHGALHANHPFRRSARPGARPR